MVKQHKAFVISWLLMAFPACNACRKLPEIPQAHFELAGQVEKSLLYLREQEQSKLIINIEPKNELAESVHYTIVNWSLPAGIKGHILDQNGGALAQGAQLQNGENICFYEPLNIGVHTLTLVIADQYGDCQKELTLPPISVAEKINLPFQVELQAEHRRIFMHQTAKLVLKLSADLAQASSAAYTVQELAMPTGSLILARSGERITPGSSLAFGTQHLLFQYTGEQGSQTQAAPIKITVSNEQGDIREATVVLELEPVTFQVDAWFRQLVNEADDIRGQSWSVLEIALTGIDQELHDESWELIAWHCSDGIQRSLVNSDRAELTKFRLNCRATNQLYLNMPTLITGDSPQIFLTIAGPGKTIREGVAPLLYVQQASVATNIASLLDTAVKENQAAAAYLNAPVKGQRYEALQAAKQATERALVKLQVAAARIENSCALQKGSFPRATVEAFHSIIEQEIPALKKKQEKLAAAYDLWDYALCDIYGIGVGDQVENYVASVYEPVYGNLTIHVWASFHGNNEKSTQFIMDRTVDINVKDKDGSTALHLAIAAKNITKLKILLKHGANPNIKHATGKTPLQYALESCQFDHIDQLLQYGADPNIS